MDTERGKEKIRNVVSGSLWKDFLEIIETEKAEAWQKGVADGREEGWNAAKAMLKMLTPKPGEAIGGTYRQSECLDNISVETAISMLKKISQEQIIVGDEITYPGMRGKYVVIDITSNIAERNIVNALRISNLCDESIWVDRKYASKTGVHYENIGRFMRGLLNG